MWSAKAGADSNEVDHWRSGKMAMASVLSCIIVEYSKKCPSLGNSGRLVIFLTAALNEKGEKKGRNKSIHRE